MKLKTFKARDLLKYTIEEIWKLPEGVFELVFDDGTISTDNRQTILSYFYWNIHRHYPDAPILTHHHVNGRTITPGLHLDLLSAVVFDTYFALTPRPDPMELSRLAYSMGADIFNETNENLGDYVTSISILDYMDIIDHPEIAKINNEALPTESSILGAYDKISDVLHGPDFEGNNIQHYSKCKLVSGDQLMQSLGPRGHVTDIDSFIFRGPLMRSYTEGFKKLEDSVKESRSGTKSLAMTKEPLSRTQFFNRRMQLGCSVVRNLHHGDCGSTRYTNFLVHDKDLKALHGLHYMDDKDGHLKVIGPGSRDVIGKTVKLRTAMTCQHSDPAGICSTCMGLLSIAVPPGTNVGHVSATQLCEPITQKTMGVKHLDKTSRLVLLHLDEAHRRFVGVNSRSGDLVMSSKQRLNGVKVIIPSDWAKHIDDINKVDRADELIPTRVSEIPALLLMVPSRNGEVEHVIPTVLTTGIRGALSTDMLSYMKINGYTFNESGDYVVDMSKWDRSHSVLMFPRKHKSMLDYMLRISSIIESGESQDENARSLKTRNVKLGFRVLSDFDSPSGALTYLYDEVSVNAHVNIAHLAVIIRSTMIRNSATRDHRLPLPHHSFECGRYQDNINNRSKSALMAYHGHRQAFLSPASYLRDNPMDHSMDAILGHIDDGSYEEMMEENILVSEV